MPRADAERVRAAKAFGSVARLRDVWAREPARVERLRTEWPGLVDAVEHLIALVRWDLLDGR